MSIKEESKSLWCEKCLPALQQISTALRRFLYFRKNTYNEIKVRLFLKITFDAYLSVHLIPVPQMFIAISRWQFPNILRCYNVKRYCTTSRRNRSKAFRDNILENSCFDNICEITVNVLVIPNSFFLSPSPLFSATRPKGQENFFKIFLASINYSKYPKLMAISAGYNRMYYEVHGISKINQKQPQVFLSFLTICSI